MRHSHSQKKHASSILLLFLPLLLLSMSWWALFGFLQAGETLLLLRGDDTIWERNMTEGETFSLTYRHSVTKQPVEETYRVQAGEIVLDEMTFDTYGANLPAGKERVQAHTSVFVRGEEKNHVYYTGRTFSSLPFLVGSEGVHHLFTFSNGDTLPFITVAAPGDIVEVTLKK